MGCISLKRFASLWVKAVKNKTPIIWHIVSDGQFLKTILPIQLWSKLVMIQNDNMSSEDRVRLYTEQNVSSENSQNTEWQQVQWGHRQPWHRATTCQVRTKSAMMQRHNLSSEKGVCHDEQHVQWRRNSHDTKPKHVHEDSVSHGTEQLHVQWAQSQSYYRATTHPVSNISATVQRNLYS